MTKIILASSSKTRHSLLRRIIESFDCINPSIDETQKLDEDPENYLLDFQRKKA